MALCDPNFTSGLFELPSSDARDVTRPSDANYPDNQIHWINLTKISFDSFPDEWKRRILSMGRQCWRLPLPEDEGPLRHREAVLLEQGHLALRKPSVRPDVSCLSWTPQSSVRG